MCTTHYVQVIHYEGCAFGRLCNTLCLHKTTRFSPRPRVMNIIICSGCVASRDPHCVWSNEELQCIASPLTGGAVDDTR